ncbi:PP2C family protein-serine/threonine phosphatase [Mycoplasma seminis]|uniref:Serine/threonine-protein phosphatase n=1 Tax=Mycoplasma seminis TaxID=512749 RepID=A0ABY9HB63_9MOLU|nr:PP2C family serine/threonine-protein phosphatase [Mycoplasma seminis]WLP85425.1 serine/threonine-protein phosphatase [Mycoplasma seminis]
MTIKYFLDSLQGIRPKNDDRASVLQNSKATLAILCDGIGGHAFGDEAAQLVIDTFNDEFQNNFFIKNNLTAKQWIFSTFEKAKNRLKQEAFSDVNKNSMGTTAVGCLILYETKQIVVFNSGDSRCYIVNNTELVQITIDHNLENKLLADGLSSKDLELYKNINSNQLKALTSAVLPNYNTLIEIFEIPTKGFESINKILLTSDGVHGFMDKNELELFMLQNKDISIIGKEVLENAILSESTDNMTLIILELQHGGENE